MDKLQGFLRSKNFHFCPVFDGVFHRFDREGNNNGWFVGSCQTLGDKTIDCLTFGDWKTGEEWTYRSETEGLTPGETKELEKIIGDQAKASQEEKERRWEEVSLECEKEWVQFIDRGRTPYLERKQIAELYGARILPNENGSPILIVPLRDIHGKLWNYQRIYSEKLSLGDKFFREGARIEGCFHLLRPGNNERRENLHALPDDLSEILIAEGFATAASIQAAFPEKTVVASFNAGNLLSIGQRLRERYPSAQITFCADNDAFTQKNGRPWNVGIEKGKLAAGSIGGKCIWPVFQTPREGDTDFNDLHIREGLGAVQDQLLKPLCLSRPSSNTPPSPRDEDDTKLPKEGRLVNQILDHLGNTILKQDRDLFLFDKTHWRHFDAHRGADYFKRLIDEMSQGAFKYKDIHSAYQRFLMNVPYVPEGINFFAPNPLVQNFRNGALHLIPQPNGTFELELKPHAKNDYLMLIHDFDYLEEAPLNEIFEETLNKIWKGDPDIERKKIAYYEVLGAALVGAFRKLVFFIGPPGSGKSSLILFAAAMVQPKYRCGVDPTKMYGFNLQTMAGKLLNFITDIKLGKPITDDILKQVEDRIDVRIERKGLADVYAPIPALHLFGGNGMPKTEENVDVYRRRMLIFRCEGYETPEEGGRQDYAAYVWGFNPQGILVRAIQGLKRLAANGGHFTIPESSKLELLEWKKAQQDPVADFLNDVLHGEFKVEEIKADEKDRLMFNDKGRLKQSLMWPMFSHWFLAYAPGHRGLNKKEFFTRLKELGYKPKPFEGLQYYSGMKLKISPNAVG